MVVGVLICCVLLHSMCDLKTARMNTHQLIQKLMLYKFELGHNVTEPTKNICCARREGAVNHSSITRWFEKLCLVCKNFDIQTSLGRSRTVDSKAISKP